MNFSVLISERTEYLLGFVGIISEQQYISQIFKFINTHGEEHRYQRKENWRRLMLITHPLLKLLNNSFDRNHLRLIDPMEYTILVDITKVKEIHSFVSQILCQRVLPTTLLFSTEMDSIDHHEIIINSFIVNGIKVKFLGTHNPPKDVLEFSPEINEHSGLDFCLARLFRTHEPLCTLDPLPSMDPAKINHRVLVIGHDLKFIRNIASIWNSWGVEVTLLQSRNHSCDLNISDQELTLLVANHDVIFCEWALGNVMKIAPIRGVRPLFIRYHLQERNTEYLIQTELNKNDRISFVSTHTCEDEIRLDPQTDILVTPNAVDCLELNIERSNPNSLGLMGITPQRKRLDFALEVIKQLHEEGITHKLIIKGKLPKDFPWMKHRVMENKWYQDKYDNYQGLFAHSHIVQEGFTPDIGTFFASISSLFSVSAFESFHLAPVEAAAARTDVLMLPWVGADQIHKSNWICDSTEDMVAKYQRLINTGLGYETGEDNRQFVMENYELRSVALRLYVEMTRNVVDRRDSATPTVKPTQVFRYLMPRVVDPGRQMYIRSLTHEENSLPLKVDGELRLIGKESQEVVILSAHIDLNLIDGSSIWFVSMASMLALSGTHVVCPISSNAIYSPIVQPLIDNQNITLITPEMMEIEYARKVTLEQYTRVVNDISRWYGESKIIVARGFELIQELTEMGKNVAVWAYLTDYYTHELDGKRVVRKQTEHLVQQIVEQGGKILCQTSLIKNELIEISNSMEENFIALPPMIPNSFGVVKKEPDSEKLNIIYAGKIAPLWGVEPLLDLASAEFSIIIIGDKIHRGPPHDAMFQSRMEMKLKTSEFIRWIPRLSRNLVLENVAMADLAWCARDPYFESQTQELSTKILESLLVGTPPIVIRSKLHEELLGNNWPFFVQDLSDRTFLIDIDKKKDMAKECMQQLQPKLANHFMENVATRFKKLLN
jgi:glycosyltransferase involved in cell wall biosynthesis